MTLTLESARTIIFSQEAIPPAVKRTAWLLFRHELTRTNPDTDRLYTPKRALRNVLGWMEEQKMNLDISRLSPREQQVLQLYALGFPQKKIALELRCRPRTVRSHLARIREKINARSIVHAVAVAVEEGWIVVSRDNGNSPY